MFLIDDYLQVLCEAVQSREVNKSQLPRILNKIKLHISIEEQYTVATQVSQFTEYITRKSAILFSVIPESIVVKEFRSKKGLGNGLRKC
jgi:hypothetical protein